MLSLFSPTTFNQHLTLANEDGHTQTQQKYSDIFTTWNSIADLMANEF